MPFIDDIWITLSPRDVAAFGQGAKGDYDEGDIREAIEVFHRDREARADYELVPLEKSPIALDPEKTGLMAVAATLGYRVEESIALPAMEVCLRAALAQLQDYLNYRLTKRLAPKKLHLGWPMVPGGAAAPDLTYGQVLDLLPGNQSGVRIRGELLSPAWSLAYLYSLGPKPDRTSACASCNKDCSLRK